MNLQQRRLQSQGLAAPRFETPAQVVEWLGAVQAQDYPAAKWAVGQRMRSATDAQLDQALADGSLLRTHILRPTWHFVTPANIRWMLALTAPRVQAFNASWYRRHDVGDAARASSMALLREALQGGQSRTRANLQALHEAAGLLEPKQPLRFSFFLMHAELEGLICSGPPAGKQQTYALLDERAPATEALPRDEALTRLAIIYMRSHGPATVEDLAWWSGLTKTDVRTGLAAAGEQLVQEQIDGRSYWRAAEAPPAPTETGAAPPSVVLHSLYDESIIAYTDRSAMNERLNQHPVDMEHFTTASLVLVANGQVVGTWRRVNKARRIIVEAMPLVPLDDAELAGLEESTARFGAFLHQPTVLDLRRPTARSRD